MILFKHKLCQAATDETTTSAGSKPEEKMVTINGVTMSYNLLQNLAMQKQSDWYSEERLTPLQQTEFNNALSTILEGISGGARYENGRYYGGNLNKDEYYGRFTGDKKENGKPRAWNGIKRNSYDAYGNAVAYINNIVSNYNSTPTEESAPVVNKTKKSWNSNAIYDYVHRRTFGLNGTPDFNAWADTLDEFKDGKRDTLKRREYLSNILRDFKLDEYDLDDEGLKNDINSWLTATDADGYLNLENLKRLGLGKFLFTHEDSGITSAEEKLNSENDARTQQLKDYISGAEGVENPYDYGSPEWQAAEDQRAQKVRENDINNFSNTAWGYTEPGEDTWSAIYDQATLDAFGQLNFSGNYIQNAIAAMTEWKKNHPNDEWGYGFDVTLPWYYTRAGETFHDDYTGYGEGDTSLKDTPWQAWIDYLLSHDSETSTDDQIYRGFWKNNLAKSNSAIKAHAALNYMMAHVQQDPDYYDIGGGMYLVPEMIDWNTGQASVIYLANTNNPTSEFGERLRVVHKYVNLGSILNKIKQTNSQLFNDLYAYYSAWKKKQVLSNKRGGILFAKKGYTLTDEEKRILSGVDEPQQIDFAKQYEPVASRQLNNKVKPVKPETLKPGQDLEDFRREKAQNSTTFQETDYIRIGTAAADIAGALMSLSGVGSVAGAITGAASTLTLFGLDVADNNVSAWDAAKGLGMGLLMDAFALIPGGGAASGLTKAAKTLVKLAGPIMSALQVYGNAEGLTSTFKKICSGNFSDIRVGEWREFSRALNGIANGTTMGAAAYNKHLGKYKVLNSKGKGEKEFTFKYKKSDGSDGTFKLTESEVQNINREGMKTGKNDAAIATIKQKVADFDLEKNVDLFNFKKTGALGRVQNSQLKPEGAATLTAAAQAAEDERLAALYSKYAAEKLAIINKEVGWKPLRGYRSWVAKNFGTDAEMIMGGKGSLNRYMTGRQNTTTTTPTVESANTFEGVQTAENAPEIDLVWKRPKPAENAPEIDLVWKRPKPAEPKPSTSLPATTWRTTTPDAGTTTLVPVDGNELVGIRSQFARPVQPLGLPEGLRRLPEGIKDITPLIAKALSAPILPKQISLNINGFDTNSRMSANEMLELYNANVSKLRDAGRWMAMINDWIRKGLTREQIVAKLGNKNLLRYNKGKYKFAKGGKVLKADSGNELVLGDEEYLKRNNGISFIGINNNLFQYLKEAALNRTREDFNQITNSKFGPAVDVNGEPLMNGSVTVKGYDGKLPENMEVKAIYTGSKSNGYETSLDWKKQWTPISEILGKRPDNLGLKVVSPENAKLNLNSSDSTGGVTYKKQELIKQPSLLGGSTLGRIGTWLITLKLNKENLDEPRPIYSLTHKNHVKGVFGNLSAKDSAYAAGANMYHTANLAGNGTADLGARYLYLSNGSKQQSGLLLQGNAEHANATRTDLAGVNEVSNWNSDEQIDTTNKNTSINYARNVDIYNDKRNWRKNLATDINTLAVENHARRQQLDPYIRRINEANYLRSLPIYSQLQKLGERANKNYALHNDFDPTKEHKASGWTAQDAKNYAELGAIINSKRTSWNVTHPYIPYIKSGGKMAEAEREKNRRAAARLLFDTTKMALHNNAKKNKNPNEVSVALLKQLMRGK